MTGRRLRKKTKAKSCRQARRRQAVRLLCSLGVEVQLAAPPLPTKSAKGPDVERFIRLLETRCQEPALLDRLRKAAKQWSDNGGHLSRGLVTEGAEAQLVDKDGNWAIRGFIDVRKSVFPMTADTKVIFLTSFSRVKKLPEDLP